MDSIPSKALVQLRDCVSYLKRRVKKRAGLALFMGTGLGSLSAYLKHKVTVPYSAIPSFPRPTAFGQKNAVVLGRIDGKGVISFEGRFHAYEGHPFSEIGFPVRVAHALGARILLATNIAGGIHPDFRCGDFVIVKDHLNFMGGNPLTGAHEHWMGERFVDLSEPYDARLIRLAEEVCRENGIPVQKGVYAAVLGPHLETRAEYRFLRRAGADLVGMSTVPEVLVARQLGMNVFVLSVVSDTCDPDHLAPVQVARVMKIARKASGPLGKFLKEFIRRV